MTQHAINNEIRWQNEIVQYFLAHEKVTSESMLVMLDSVIDFYVLEKVTS